MAEWLVARDLGLDARGEPTLIAGNQGLINWQEDGIQNQLLASQFAGPPTAAEQAAAVNSLMGRGIAQTGTLAAVGCHRGFVGAGAG